MTTEVRTRKGAENVEQQDPKRLQLLRTISPYVSDLVYQAFEAVDRKSFTPADEIKNAYADVVIPLEGEGSTMSQPTLVAEMTELLGLTGKENVLEIGTGSGYSAAILAKCAAQVTTIEINPQLAKKAKTRLNRLGFQNVTVHAGDGHLGFVKKAPFDAIVVTAATRKVPRALIKQLVVGGRIVIPIGSETNQVLRRITKLQEGVTKAELFSPVRFVPLVNSI